MSGRPHFDGKLNDYFSTYSLIKRSIGKESDQFQKKFKPIIKDRGKTSFHILSYFRLRNLKPEFLIKETCISIAYICDKYLYYTMCLITLQCCHVAIPSLPLISRILPGHIVSILTFWLKDL